MKHPEAIAAAARGLGVDDLLAQFRIGRAEAKAIVWAAHDKGSQRDPGRVGSDGLGHDGQGLSAQGREARSLASLPSE